MTCLRHIAGALRPPAGTYDADIVILALGRAAETEAAIGSALAQTGVSRHVTVVDQGSTPETIARLVKLFEGRSDATLVAVRNNCGVAGGRNIASELGWGRVIVGLDNDAQFADTTTVARAVAALGAEPDLAALGFRILLATSGTDDLSSWGYPRSLLPLAGGTFQSVTFVGAGHAIRRAAWDDAGGYDAALFFCWEEYDFCLRAIQRGWRVRYRGDLEVYHSVSPERRITWSGDRWLHFVRNRLYIERKCGVPWITLAPRVVGYLVKGLRHHHLVATFAAVAAAAAMDTRRHPLSGAARNYLWRNDRAHRGSLLQRVRQEIIAM